MLGERIKTYISDSGLKFSAVAEKAGLSLSTFSAMINGKRKISAEEYFSICLVLGVPLEKFLSVA